MSTTFILRATETFALIFTLAVLQFIIFTVISPLIGGLLIIISWIPYLILETYHRKWY
jgi:hypothetical protein